jgi:homospermidine synthase
MNHSDHRALIIGCQGGVGHAVLALLQYSAAGQLLREQLDRILLVDRRPPDGPVPLEQGELLPPTTIESAEDLARLVREHHITEVIDLSSIDTVDCTRACDELGAHFLCTSVEEWPWRGSIPTDEAIARLIPPRRPVLSRRSHLVGSGANPGIVNALAFAAIEEFARRVGVAPTPDALELHTVLITEDDTTAARDAPQGNVFAMTWSPAHCLEELFEPRAFAARDGIVVGLGHGPIERRYRARCGDRLIDGMAVPHEETVTLTRLLPGVEIAFIYQIPLAARCALAAHSERRSVAEWRLHRLFPPFSTMLEGQDRVGVLLCSRCFGELWLGFDTDVSAGLTLGTNATQLQVAAGVLAGWTQLGSSVGIHFVEKLDWPGFLSVVSEVLGPTEVVHDLTAGPLTLADRAEVGIGSSVNAGR